MTPTSGSSLLKMATGLVLGLRVGKQRRGLMEPKPAWKLRPPQSSPGRGVFLIHRKVKNLLGALGCRTRPSGQSASVGSAGLSFNQEVGGSILALFDVS